MPALSCSAAEFSLPIDFYRFSILISSGENTNQVVVSRGGKRIELQDLAQIFFGVAGIAGVKVSESKLVMSIRIVRIEIHQPDETLHCFFILSLNRVVASFNQTLLAVSHRVA